MAVVADHLGEILAAAARQPATDPVFRKLSNYVALERAYCLYGLVPGSIEDEASPFNGCAHAYLAAAEALVRHMAAMPGAAPAAAALVARIEAESRARAPVVCRWSGAGFDVRVVRGPEWAAVPRHGPSLATFAGLAAMAVCGAAMLGRALARPRDPG